jgi:Protein of unknown function (DUF1612)/HTH DNA binding domain
MRRRILSQKPDWALGREGLRELTGRGAPVPATGQKSREGEGTEASSVDADARDDVWDDVSAEEFAEIDAVLARSSKIQNGANVPARKEETSLRDRPDLIYDLDWDEDARLAEWQDVIARTGDLPIVLRAAILLEAWSDIEVLQHGVWLGPLLVAALLRQEGLAANHLSCLHLGAKNIPRERRRARTRSDRLLACLDGIHDAALVGLKEHDRLTMAKSQMERRLRERRASSRLPDLVELVLSRPLVSTGMIQDKLKVTKQGALNLVGELGLREMTGRGRFRAWGII